MWYWAQWEQSPARVPDTIGVLTTVTVSMALTAAVTKRPLSSGLYMMVFSVNEGEQVNRHLSLCGSTLLDPL